ncbi:MAG: hypothetical protein KAT65_29805 [Methanophagales archaeon]|nr:hypothetical protein [Methanophagales archaeon]
MEKCSEDEEYCKYCGEDIKKGHTNQCPLVHGIRVNPEGYMGFGFKADPNDVEWNLHMERMMILLQVRGDGGLGPKDKKIAERLAYESAKLCLERVNGEINYLSGQKSNPLKRIFANRKINKLEKVKARVRKFAEGWLPPEKVENLFYTTILDESRRKVFEFTKNVKVDMEILKEKEKETQDPMFMDAKTPKEFKWRHWALNASMSGEFEKAIEFCSRGLKINPESAYLLYMRGRSKGDLGELKGGIEDLNRAIELYPNFAEAYAERSAIKTRLGDQEGALEDYKKAKEIDPTSVIPSE